MNTWKHRLLSQRKFGGQPEEYLSIHSFLDSSKLFCYHVKHRALIHNLFGIELCTDLFGNYLVNADGVHIPVRDIAAEHCKEDLSNIVPTLHDWFAEADAELAPTLFVPPLDDPELHAFVMKPYLRCGLRSSLMITCSDFGVYLTERLLGMPKALLLAQALAGKQPVKSCLERFRFTQRWQYTPDKNELTWLKQQQIHETRTTTTPENTTLATTP